MSGLWIAAVLMTAAAAAAVLAPLVRRPGPDGPGRREFDLAVYRDQLAEIDRDVERGVLGAAEAEAARIEIQRRMLAAAETTERKAARPPGGRWTAVVVGVAAPVVAFGLYFALGSPEVPNHPFAERQAGAGMAAGSGAFDRGQVTALAERLKRRLENDPGNVEGWVLLARTYLTIDAFTDAIAAYRRAMAAGNRDSGIAAGYAEALVLRDGGRVAPEARAMFADVAGADPFNPIARYYLGLARAQGGDLRGALQAWVDLRAVSPAGAPWIENVERQIARAAADLGVAPSSVRPSAPAVALAAQLPAPGAEGGAPPAAAPPRQQGGPSAEDMAAAAEMSAADRQAMIRSMVQRLADRLRDNPDDEAGWRRLARAYEVLGEAEKANDAMTRADALAAKRR